MHADFAHCLKAVQITRVIDSALAKVFPAAPWLTLPIAAGEVVAALSEALSPEWVVERETDYDGEVSIVAVPINDNEQTPAFMLYEKDGQARVAMIRCDEWEHDHGFTSFRQAMDAFVLEARASASDDGSLPRLRQSARSCRQVELQFGR